MALKQIKYELGPTYKTARDLELGLQIWYFSDGKASVKLTWLMDPAKLGDAIRDTQSRHITLDVGKEYSQGIIKHLTNAEFFALRSAARSNADESRYQRLKLYRPAHDVIAQKIAYPQSIEQVIKDIRAPFEEHLKGYEDPNERLRAQGLVLRSYIKGDSARLDKTSWDDQSSQG